MPYLIGTDEAGYGPNLGPLVVSTSVWRVPDDGGGRDLFELLGGAVVRSVKEVGNVADGRCVVADSKRVYKPGGGLGPLERTLFAAWRQAAEAPSSWRAIWPQLVPGCSEAIDSEPWYADYDARLPIDGDPAEIAAADGCLRRVFTESGVALVAATSRAVFPARFNRLVERFGSKGAALTYETLDLAAAAIRPLGDEPIRVVCDKHGGRNHYTAPLWEHFAWAPRIETCEEGRDRSVYRFGPKHRRIEFCFQTGGEAHLPTALASMQSKYLRELAMRAFNHFWRRHLPGLKPTAGYPADAKRFRREIAAKLAELRIDETTLWRMR